MSLFFEVIGVMTCTAVGLLVLAYMTGFVSFERGAVDPQDEEKVH